VKMPTALPRFGNLASVPAGLAVALVVFVTGYWGLHGMFYGPERTGEPAPLTTHSASPEYPHGPQTALPANRHRH